MAKTTQDERKEDKTRQNQTIRQHKTTPDKTKKRAQDKTTRKTMKNKTTKRRDKTRQ